MYNYYDFEADFPRNKAVRKFLLSDYFHDSKLCALEFNREKAELTLRLQCSRDWETAGKGTIDNEAYSYILRFRGVAGLRNEINMTCPDYINGRFKKTSWLVSQQADKKQKLYQFRIGFADGYLDILFHDFRIRKAVGRINYRDIDDLDNFVLEWYRRSPEQLHELQKTMLSGNDQMMDDFRLECLYANGAEDLPFLCREVLKKAGDKDTKAYAAWLLGKCGMSSDRKLIWKTYHELLEHSEYKADTNDMRTLNFFDAIEALTETTTVID